MSDAADIARAAEIIRAGGLVAMPTETVYGLAADATRDSAVARIFEAKGRPRFNPLIVHFLSAEAADAEVEFPPLAMRLATRFWPGPLTLVLPRRKDSTLSLLVSAGLDTAAVRSPAHPLARALLAAASRPLAAPSANLSGAVSPTTAAHVRDGLGDRVDMILDGGACEVGVESTIIKVDGGMATLLRAGGVAREAIEAETGAPLHSHSGGVEAPGMLQSHYAPDASVRLNAVAPRPGEAFLGFGDIAGGGSDALNLSASGDLREAAANLFSYLRLLDARVAAAKLTGVAVAPIPERGLGEAINDRLRRAAAPRND